MLRLAEYRQRPAVLADWLPWAGLVAPGIVLNKDGSLQRTARFRGPDLDSATEQRARRHRGAAQQRAAAPRDRLGAVRRSGAHAGGAPIRDRRFPEPLSWLVDEERRAAFEAAGSHFESSYWVTLLWLPPAEAKAQGGARHARNAARSTRSTGAST